MNPLLEPIVKSSRMWSHLRELEGYAQAEHQRRLAFYEWLDEDKKAEFINGEVIVHSPTTWRHNEVQQRVAHPTRTFALMSAVGRIGIAKATIKLDRNDYMPDVCFWRAEVARTFTSDQQLMPAPDWIAEVLSPSTEKVDRGEKFEDYAAAGVREYWIIDADAQCIEQYVLAGASYTLVNKHTSGVVPSVAIEGFAMPVEAAFDDEANMKFVKELVG